LGIEENVSEYWDRRPCGEWHSRAKDLLQYSIQTTAWKKYVEPHLWEFAEFPNWCGARVLDLGCGIGTEALEFARHGADVVAVDYSQQSLDIAAERAQAEDLRIDFRLQDFQQPVIVKPNTFDLVWAWGSIHHAKNPAAVLHWVPLYMAPGAEFRMMVYHRFSTKALRLWAEAGFPLNFDGAVARGSEAQPNCPTTHTYTRWGARRLLENAGLDVLSVKVTHIFPWQGDAYGRRQWVKGWLWKVLPTWPLERLMGWHLMVNAC
jgi:SAM-dependent methyltransferase